MNQLRRNWLMRASSVLNRCHPRKERALPR